MPHSRDIRYPDTPGPTLADVQRRARERAERAAEAELLADRQAQRERRAEAAALADQHAALADKTATAALFELGALYAARAEAADAAAAALVAFLDLEAVLVERGRVIENRWINDRSAAGREASRTRFAALRADAGLDPRHARVGATVREGRAGQQARVVLELLAAGLVGTEGVQFGTGFLRVSSG